MRVAFVFPNYWPYVRRGAERLMAEYAQYLTSAGHSVDIITSKPGRKKMVRNGKLTIYYEPQIDHPVLNEYWFWFRFYSFCISALLYLMRCKYDVVHIWFYTYGLAARIGRWVRGTPYLYQSMAEELTWPGRFDRWLLNRVVLSADKLAALTPRAAGKMEAELGVPVEILPPCVDLNTFRPMGQLNTERPRVLFVSDATDFRKGASLLLMAWDEVYRRCPRAILSFGGPYGQTGIRRDQDIFWRIRELVINPQAREAIEFLGAGEVADLPRRYAEAAVTVLPSMGEVFGLVLVESLACGTPVVGNSHEGPGEIISNHAIGSTVNLEVAEDLVSPERAHQLAEAILHAIALSKDPKTADRCREHVHCWGRDLVGQELVRVYRDMMD